MPNRSQYPALVERHPDFARQFSRRVLRGDTNATIQFWIFAEYGVRVSDTTIGTWRTKHVRALRPKSEQVEEAS